MNEEKYIEENADNAALWRNISIVLALAIVGGAIVLADTKTVQPEAGGFTSLEDAQSYIQNVEGQLQEEVLPSEGIELPIVWGDLGKQMVLAGVIDKQRYIALYEQRGGISDEHRQLLLGNSADPVVMTRENSTELLNLFWAFGLSNKNEILEQGPMSSPKNGKTRNYASTGGWSLSKGDVMNHYSAHAFVALTPQQQALVERVSKGIYRPCCGNSVYFPDCNHGMAMLGLLELMAANGASEEEIYKVALSVNSYWFPQTYVTIAKYFRMRDVAWSDVNPQEILASAYSGSRGYRNILAEVEPAKGGGGQGCGV